MFHENLCISFWVALTQQQYTLLVTDIHFPKIVKSSSGHPKKCKSTKIQKSEIFTKTLLPSIKVGECKNKLTIKSFG